MKIYIRLAILAINLSLIFLSVLIEVEDLLRSARPASLPKFTWPLE